MCAVHFSCYEAKWPSLKLKTWPKQLLGYLLLDIALPNLSGFFDSKDGAIFGAPLTCIPLAREALLQGKDQYG
jgi:hypothetical protein